MESTHAVPRDHSRSSPTIPLAWAHFAIAMACAAMAITGAMPEMLGLLGMALFGTIAIVCALLTITL